MIKICTMMALVTLMLCQGICFGELDPSSSNFQVNGENSDAGLANEVSKFGEFMQLFMSPEFPFNVPDDFEIPQTSAFLDLLLGGTKPKNPKRACHACRVTVGYLIEQIRSGIDLENIENQMIKICTFFQLKSESVCKGLVERMLPSTYYMLSTKEIPTNLACGIVFEPSGCVAPPNFTNWNIDISKISGRKDLDPLRKPILANGFSGEKVKILQLADIHLDLEYKIGYNADCGGFLCCHVQDGFGNHVERSAAGKYGHYGTCDLPLNSFEDALQHIASEHTDIDLIYMTGDLLPHNMDSTTEESTEHTIRIASALIKKYFKETLIIPVIGNHDVHPANLFSPMSVPANLSTSRSYNFLYEQWNNWISLEKTFKNGGFYAVQMTPTFKIIVINTNICYTLNFWQMYDHEAPRHQFLWLVKELEEAQRHGMKVHIVGHVPLALDGWSACARNYYQIINRYSETVSAQFFAHMHWDEFQVYYDEMTHAHPVSSIFLGGSLSPYMDLNPGYKIYTVDPSTSNVLDHETWIYDLEEANREPETPPKWFQLYKATEAYGIKDVSPASLNELVHCMACNQELFNKYYRNYNKACATAPRCDTVECRKRYLCRIVTPYHGKMDECLKIKAEVDAYVANPYNLGCCNGFSA